MFSRLVSATFRTGVPSPFVVPRRDLNILVIGGGQMGGGIAQVSAQSGHKVVIADMSEEVLAKGTAVINKSLSRVAAKKYADDEEAGKKFVASVMANLSTTTDPVAAVKNSDIVIEAIVENIKIKQDLFKKLDDAAPPATIFASNTSSLNITDIASVTNRKDRFGGLHFFNPVPMMKLVEVVKAPATSDETHNALLNFGNSVGKTTVTCTDTPGFVVNRLLVPYLSESIRLLERGVATPEDIDNAMKLGAGHPMGPLTLCDFIGLDTIKFILDGWSKAHPEEQTFQPIPLLNKLVAEGKLGKKSGEGFYKY